MSNHESLPATPIYIKDTPDAPWPEDKVFYVVGSQGISLCRNHEMFRSSTRVDHGPSELAEQIDFLEPRYPIVPRALFEQLVGFFAAMADMHGCEAGAYLVYDRDAGTVSARVPRQVTEVSESYNGSRWPIGFDYQNLDPLPPHQLIFGTIHSHVYGPAYASGIDVHDEVDKPGVHLVVGQLDLDPPDFHVAAVVDGARFPLRIEDVTEGFVTPRDDYPAEWLEQVTVKVQKWQRYDSGSSYGSSSGSGSYGHGSYGHGGHGHGGSGYGGSGYGGSYHHGGSR